MPVLADFDLDGRYSAAINSLSANGTVCPECHCDDFTHSESCKLKEEALDCYFREYSECAESSVS